MIYIASDHAGFELKNKIIENIKKENVGMKDVYPIFNLKDDYPNIVRELCKKMKDKDKDFGIMICATGIGSSIAANKIKGIRAALCYDENTAKMTRKDNNANVLCLGSLTKSGNNIKKVMKIVKTFVETEFSKEERHIRRIDQIKEMERVKWNM